GKNGRKDRCPKAAGGQEVEQSLAEHAESTETSSVLCALCVLCESLFSVTTSREQPYLVSIFLIVIMMGPAFLSLVAVLTSLPLVQSEEAVPAQALVLTGVTLIDATGAPAEPGMTV